MPEEKVMTPELAAALAKFQEKFAERSYSQRHSDLGKMINCRLCGKRHREADPILKDSTAHGAQPAAIHDNPSATTYAKMTKRHRIFEHHSARLLQLVERTRKIFHEDIEPYFAEEGQDRLVKRARRRAVIQLKRERAVRDRACQHQQDVSRRINLGLLPGGSR
jgi:hypothetical protein